MSSELNPAEDVTIDCINPGVRMAFQIADLGSGEGVISGIHGQHPDGSVQYIITLDKTVSTGFEGYEYDNIVIWDKWFTECIADENGDPVNDNITEPDGQ